MKSVINQEESNGNSLNKTVNPDNISQSPRNQTCQGIYQRKNYSKTHAQGKHSIIQRELNFFLTTAFRLNKTAQAFPELRCTFGDRSIVPDIAVFRSERIPKENNGDIANAFNLHPDWIIEILSPNQSQTRVIRNILHCLDNGTEMGWLIDPDESCVFVYFANQSVREFVDSDRVLPTPDFFKGVELTVGELFSWLQI